MQKDLGLESSFLKPLGCGMSQLKCPTVPTDIRANVNHSADRFLDLRQSLGVCQLRSKFKYIMYVFLVNFRGILIYLTCLI
jgi:hypothetical protein